MQRPTRLTRSPRCGCCHTTGGGSHSHNTANGNIRSGGQSVSSSTKRPLFEEQDLLPPKLRGSDEYPEPGEEGSSGKRQRVDGSDVPPTVQIEAPTTLADYSNGETGIEQQPSPPTEGAETVANVASGSNTENERPMEALEYPPSSTLCAYCGERYPIKTKTEIRLFEHHKKMHYGQLPFPCPYCELGFVSAVAVLTHCTRHTGEANYECGNNPKCEARFLSLKALQAHKKTCELAK